MIIHYAGYDFNLSNPIDISTPLHAGEPQINCYYAPPFNHVPVVAGNFIGSTEEGGSVNYKNIFLNPHGNGTHTECVAHISNLPITINQALLTYHFSAQLITVTPQKTSDGDFVISKSQITELITEIPEALILRTLPNTAEKLSKNYNNTNPPYLHHDAAAWMCENGIEHLLIDLPSVDREQDEGKLLAHKAFFNYPHQVRLHSTITELIYVPDHIPDDSYLLNLQIVSFELDASPSKPVLYRREHLISY